MISKRSFLQLIVLGASLGRAGLGHAESYPARPIKIVVPFPAGGPTDVLGRLAAQRLSASLGQGVVVENEAGAGGRTGSHAVARANPDGYTLLLGGTNSNAMAHALYRNLNYDPVKDFAPIASIATDSDALVIAPAVPAKTIKEFVQYAKTNPGKLISGATIGIFPHFALELFSLRTGIDVIFVPYKGGATSVADFLGGQIQMTAVAKSVALPYIRVGKMRALAVTSTMRWPELPDVPTMREGGFADFPSEQWFGLLAPAATPTSVILKLNGAMNEGLQSPEARENFAKLGVDIKTGTPSDFAAIVAEGAQTWESIVKETGIRLE